MARQRAIETTTACPHCGGKLHMRQTSIEVDHGHVGWADTGRFCPNGCRYTADEVRE